MDIQKQVKEFLYDESLKEEFDELTSSDSLLEAGIIDSVKMLELITFIEETFGIKVDEDDLFPENFDSLQAIEEFINSK